MKKMLLLGDEAVAQAAIDAGLGGAFGYPGTPSTEVFEYLQKYSEKTQSFPARWAGNEKVALEEALGMSFVGKKAIVTMKSVGINVAADPFMCSAITGVNGGLIVLVADDPGMHSSQNEQDARYMADFARMPCYEPCDQQECYDMTREAFEVSEKYRTPVLMRLVTRISHSRAPVMTAEPVKTDGALHLQADTHNWILLPAIARRQFPLLLKKREELKKRSANCKWNFAVRANRSTDEKKGVICCGTAYNYFQEACARLGVELDCLKLGFYPAAGEMIEHFIAGKKEILVLEDGYPYIEERILGLCGVGPVVRGRTDGTANETGEMNPDNAIAALSKFTGRALKTETYKTDIPQRPPMLCNGCPHGDTFRALNAAMASRQPGSVFADIGCYTLGALKPYEAIHACVEMGASVGMAKGAAMGGLKYSAAVIGDSTFEHSGLTSLLGAVTHKTPMTLLILDNSTTAMTGAQDSLANGDRLIALIAGIGVEKEHIRIIKPLPRNHEANTAVIGEELEYRGVSVIIAQRECIQILGKK